MNCLNHFRAAARGKHYEYNDRNGLIKVNIPSKEEKWLKFHEGQYKFKDTDFLILFYCINAYSGGNVYIN